MSRPLRPFLALGVALTLCACRSTGAAPPSPTASPATAVPTDTAMPAPGSGSVDTVEEALAAVIAAHPEYEGYELIVEGSTGDASSPHPVIGRPAIGANRFVIPEHVAAGFQLTFVTGSGDCPAGCIQYRYDVFLVTADGSVELRCTTETPPILNGDPCQAA